MCHALRLAARFGLALGLAVPALASAYPLFVPPVPTYAMVARPVAVVAADFDGDGRADVATADDSADVVCVRLGRGDGTFGPPASFAAGAHVQGLSAGDLDGDGVPDLVTGHGTGFGVLLGRGDGTFAPRVDRTIGYGVLRAALHDLNGDGRLDAVLITNGSSGPPVLFGNGDGTFGAATNYDVFAPNGCAFGDVNGDGVVDMVIGGGDCGGRVSFLPGRGDGTFGPAVLVGPLCNPYGVLVADMDRDGKADIVVSELGFNRVVVYLGLGAGAFAAPTQTTILGPAFVLDVADLDGDGDLDVAAPCLGANALSVLPGNGAGGFGARQDCGVGARPLSIARADFDSDGVPDYAVANHDAHTISVLLGTGGVFPLAVPPLAPANAFGMRVSPNPLVSSARVLFTLPADASVTLRLFDAAGRCVATSACGVLGAGPHALAAPLAAAPAPGAYVLELQAGGRRASVRIAVVR